jgi:hypothetical protein
VLRLAFPEEGLGYAAEEMEGQTTETGGVTIEGKVDHGDPGLTARDRQAHGAFPPKPPPAPPGDATDPLEEPNGTIWLKNLGRLLDACKTAGELAAIRGHQRVLTTLAEAPTMIRRDISDRLQAAGARLAPPDLGEPPDDDPPPDGDDGLPPPDQALADMMTEVDAMDAISLAGLATNAAWRRRRNDLFPTDADTLDEHIAERVTMLRTAKR